ncbi:MAG: hypothetical protein ACRDLL_12995 [Solirubrobacterales bacterium]
MPDSKISALTELAAQPALDDLFDMVDVSDTSEAATGTNKRIKFQNLIPAWTGAFFPPRAIASVPASSTSGVSNTWYGLIAVVLAPTTITGIRYRVGSAPTGNVRSGLYDNQR